jgi:hypothetical protein
MMAQMQPMFFYPGQGGFPPYSATAPATPALAPATSTTNPFPKTSAVYPDVEYWFRFLDKHEHRNKYGISFAQYGAILKNHGFLCINQLVSKFVSLDNIQEWLGIKVGTAILIMQYVAEDIATIESGSWVFPQSS